jgi:hypothetical protein
VCGSESCRRNGAGLSCQSRDRVKFKLVGWVALVGLYDGFPRSVVHFAYIEKLKTLLCISVGCGAIGGVLDLQAWDLRPLAAMELLKSQPPGMDATARFSWARTLDS